MNVHRPRAIFCGFCVMALLLVASPFALAQQSASTGRTITDFSRVLSVGGFDSAQGELVAADISLSAELDSRVLEIINNSGTAADFTVTTTVSFCGDLGATAISYVACAAATTPTALKFETAILSESFVALDPGGRAASSQSTTSADAGSMRVLDGPSLANFVDVAQVDFSVSTLAGFEALGGGGNSLVEIETFANATAQIDYLFADVSIAKLTNGGDGVAVNEGDPIEWVYDVTNTGNTALQNAVVSDDLEGSICTLALIEPGETLRCTATGLAGASAYQNLATVVAEPVINPSITVAADDPSSYVVLTPTPTPTAVPPTPTAVPPTPTAVPPTPTPTATLVPPTSVPATPTPSPVPPTAVPPTAVPPFAVPTTAAPVTPATPVPSPETPEPPATPTSDVLTPSSAPLIDIELATNGHDADLPPGVRLNVGDPITWTYVVTNTGVVDLYRVVVDDDLEGGVCRAEFVPIGGQFSCTLDGFAKLGQFERIGNVLGESIIGQRVADVDPTNYIAIDEVLSLVTTPVVAPVQPVVPPTTPDEALARTGIDKDLKAIFGLGFVMVGCGAMAVSRSVRRRSLDGS